MRIDITEPEGNTYVALGLAIRLLKQAGADATEIQRLRQAVADAGSAVEARRIISAATHGSIEFFDPRNEDEEAS